MCSHSNVLIYGLAACIFVNCFQGTESVSTISVASYSPGLNCGTDVVLECTITGPYSASGINKYWEGPPSTTPLTVDGVKYVENEVATTKYSLTVTDFSLSDVGEYTCTYIFEGTSNPAVALNYECYSNSSLVAACENGLITIKVDEVYPDIPTTALTVTVTDSSNTPVPGTVTSWDSTEYPNHFLLTWTSTSSTLADATYTYDVWIVTSIAGPVDPLATGASVTCGSSTTPQPTTNGYTTNPTTNPTTAHTTNSPSKDSTPLIIGVSIGGAVVLVTEIIVVVCWCVRKHRNRQEQPKQHVSMRDIDFDGRSHSNSGRERNINLYTPHAAQSRAEGANVRVSSRAEGANVRVSNNAGIQRDYRL